MAMIQVELLYKSYGLLEVLKDINLSVEEGEVVSIVGASGAGKTTLLQIIGTLDRPDKGNVSIDGTSLARMSDRELSRFRNRHIGFVSSFIICCPNSRRSRMSVCRP